MKAVISGEFLKMSSYHSEKKNADIPQVILFDGQDAITVDAVPSDYGKGKKLGDKMTVPVKVYNGQYGLRISYDMPTADVVKDLADD